VKATGDEIAEADIRSAWEATAVLAAPAIGRKVTTGGSDSRQATVDWHRVGIEESEQLDLFAAIC